MKILYFIFSLLLVAQAYGQEVKAAKDDVRIKLIFRYVSRNGYFPWIKNTNNKAAKPYLVLHFNAAGNLLDKKGYGKQHNASLKVLDFIDSNIYEKGLLIKTLSYQTDYRNNFEDPSESLYFYDAKNQLIEEKNSQNTKDSLLIFRKYEYDSLGNKTKIVYNNSEYEKRTFDKGKRLILLQRFFENKLYWEYVYTYKDSLRIGEFKAYDNDDKYRTKRELVYYKNGSVIKIEEYYTSKDGIGEKTLFYYNRTGLIKKKNIYRRYANKDKYRLERSTRVKARYTGRLSGKSIGLINDQLFD